MNLNRQIKKTLENRADEDTTTTKKRILPIDEALGNDIIFTVHYSDGSHCATFVWVSLSELNSDEIMQPAISTINPATSYLSYDGQANFIGGYNNICMPSDGTLYPITTGPVYFFNNNNPLQPEKAYMLNKNNKSIRMNNISIFNTDLKKGVMMNFRASMEGVFREQGLRGYIVALAEIVTIN